VQYELNKSNSYNSEINLLHQLRLKHVEILYPAMVFLMTPDYYNGLVIATQSLVSLQQNRLPCVVKLNWITKLNRSYTFEQDENAKWQNTLN